ncbi:unnamed protein product [Polarella glacialis]|uniref:Pentatricopeptide repeat-containing protein, chloroplastic n=2 Tax=Polarella glacialis TaxID=89957 RepID=A0A813JMZ6_POLGL|nr:unnamed protein product [Polarella glacialis]
MSHNNNNNNKNNKQEQELVTPDLAAGKPQPPRSPITACFGAALHACDRGSRWQHALLLLDMAGEAGYALDVAAQSAAVSACGRAGRWERSLLLLQELHASQGGSADAVARNAAVAACGGAGQWQWASWLLYQRGGPLPDVVSCSSLVDSLGRVSRWQAALGLLGDMSSMKVEANSVSYAAAISACSTAAMWQHALALLEDSKRSKQLYSRLGVNSAASACRRAGHWRLAVELLLQQPRQQQQQQQQQQQLQQHKATSSETPGIQAQSPSQAVFDPVSFGALLSAYERGGRWELSLHTFFAQNEGPSSTGCEALGSAMTVCGRANRWQEALLLAEGRDGTQTDGVSLCCLTRACEASSQKPQTARAVALVRRFAAKTLRRAQEAPHLADPVGEAAAMSKVLWAHDGAAALQQQQQRQQQERQQQQFFWRHFCHPILFSLQQQRQQQQRQQQQQQRQQQQQEKRQQQQRQLQKLQPEVLDSELLPLQTVPGSSCDLGPYFVRLALPALGVVSSK